MLARFWHHSSDSSLLTLCSMHALIRQARATATASPWFFNTFWILRKNSLSDYELSIQEFLAVLYHTNSSAERGTLPALWESIKICISRYQLTCAKEVPKRAVPKRCQSGVDAVLKQCQSSAKTVLKRWWNFREIDEKHKSCK